MINEHVLIELVEKFLRGELSAPELNQLNELRKNNQEVDELVVEQLLMFKSLNDSYKRQSLINNIDEIHGKLKENGALPQSQALSSGGKVVNFWKKYKRTVTIAASIAGVTAMMTSSILHYFTPRKDESAITQLKQEITKVKKSQYALINEVNNPTKKPARAARFGGTGFLIDEKGYILTNAHVVKKADSVYVENGQGTSFKVTVLYLNETTDIAVLKIIDANFNAGGSIPFGFSKKTTQLGERIFTLGFPRDEIVYNEGYLSAKTGFGGDTLAFQISISANPGNSGGPIFNDFGEVIGVLSGKVKTEEDVVFANRIENIYVAVKELKVENGEKIRLNTFSKLKSSNRISQVKQIEAFVFKVKSY